MSGIYDSQITSEQTNPVRPYHHSVPWVLRSPAGLPSSLHWVFLCLFYTQHACFSIGERDPSSQKWYSIGICLSYVEVMRKQLKYELLMQPPLPSSKRNNHTHLNKVPFLSDFTYKHISLLALEPCHSSMRKVVSVSPRACKKCSIAAPTADPLRLNLHFRQFPGDVCRVPWEMPPYHVISRLGVMVTMCLRLSPVDPSSLDSAPSCIRP